MLTNILLYSDIFSRHDSIRSHGYGKFVKIEQHKVIVASVHQLRIKPKTEDTTTTLLIENRNLNRMPYLCHGSMICIQINNEYKIGLIDMLTDDKFSVCLWKKRSFFSKKHCGIFPDFCLLSKYQYKCFDDVPIKISNKKINFFFVNQISGVKENVKICTNDHIDNHDKCYISNHEGPDIILMPKKIVSHKSRLSIAP